MKDRDPLFVEVMASLGSGKITAAPIPDDPETGHAVLGLCEGRHVWVDESKHQRELVSTLIHELIHRVRPHWQSERYVNRRTTMIMRTLTDDEVRRIYETYLAIRETRKTKRRFEA